MGNGITDALSGGAQKGNQHLAEEYAKIQGELPGYFNKGVDRLNPYAQAGEGALADFSSYLGHLGDQVNDPNLWMAKYQESPQAKFQIGQGLNAANSAAAGAGLLGGRGNRSADMQIAQGIASKDMQNYFNNMMAQEHQYGAGLGALSGMGLGASGSIADLYKSLGGDMAQLGAKEAQANSAAHQAKMSGKNSGINGLVSTSAWL